MGGRLFEGLEQRVERVAGEPMHFIDHVDLEATRELEADTYYPYPPRDGVPNVMAYDPRSCTLATAASPDSVWLYHVDRDAGILRLMGKRTLPVTVARGGVACLVGDILVISTSQRSLVAYDIKRKQQSWLVELGGTPSGICVSEDLTCIGIFADGWVQVRSLASGAPLTPKLDLGAPQSQRTVAAMRITLDGAIILGLDDGSTLRREPPWSRQHDLLTEDYPALTGERSPEAIAAGVFPWVPR